MPKKGNILDTEIVLEALPPIINLFIAFVALLFMIELIAPLLGGRLYPSALMLYGSQIGIALVLRYMIKKMREKIPLKGYVILMIIFYGIICMFLWFSYPLNIVFSILIVVGNLAGYNAQLKWKS